MDEFAKKHQETRILYVNELLKLLEFHSWSEDLINKAESNLGLNAGYRYIIFPNGLPEIICFFEHELDRKMLQELSSLIEPLKVREKISSALIIRIMNVISKKAALNCGGYYICPSNTVLALKIAQNSVDTIWKYAGDKSTDFNYYTKRGLLLSVYMASWTFYFGDDSPNYVDTREFIKNALDNIINIASFKNNIKLPKMEDIPIIRLFS